MIEMEYQFVILTGLFYHVLVLGSVNRENVLLFVADEYNVLNRTSQSHYLYKELSFKDIILIIFGTHLISDNHLCEMFDF
jgi:hypothetical protein